MKRVIVLFTALLLISQISNAQISPVISATVVDEYGAPISFLPIYEVTNSGSYTGIGVITDIQGVFHLRITFPNLILVSAVGYIPVLVGPFPSIYNTDIGEIVLYEDHGKSSSHSQDNKEADQIIDRLLLLKRSQSIRPEE